MWEEYVQELIEYQQKFGHCCVSKQDDKYKDLYDWIQHVRSSYARLQRGEVPSIELDDDLIANLQSLGLRLSRRESRWKRRLKELVQFRNTNGHFQVPPNSKDYHRLSTLLLKLQKEYIRREQGEDISIMADMQLAKLEKLGYDFQAHDYYLKNSPSNRPRGDDKLWQLRVQELKDFKQKHGHFNVPKNDVAHKKLWYWMHNNRHAYLKIENGEESSSRLTKERLSQLNNIGFTFSDSFSRSPGKRPKNYDKLWKLRLQELKEFKRKHGHFDVPSVDDGPHNSLCHWMKNNQNSYSRIQNGKESSRLTKERLSQLNDIGFTFSDSKPRPHLGTCTLTSNLLSDRWDQRIQELREFQETHGHFEVPANVEKYKQLSNWMHTNRHHYNKIRKGEKSSRLTSERLIQLMDLGFKFVVNRIGEAMPTLEERWNLRVNELETFKKAHGHFRIPTNDEKYKTLYNWVSNYQQEYNKVQKGMKSRLTDQRIAQLESIGFRFENCRGDDAPSGPQERWNHRVTELEAFKETHGHFDIPGDDDRYKQLSNWVVYNQVEYNKVQKGTKSNRLTDQRMAQLESIGFRFVKTDRISDAEERWNLRLKELETFKKVHAHFRIPTNDEKYKTLYNWVSTNQAEYNKLKKGLKSRLTDQRIAQLESIGFRFENCRGDDAPSGPQERWNRRVTELAAFKEAHGHFDIPSNDEKYKQLSNWVVNNQVEYNKVQKGTKSSRLTDQRMAQLESIGFRFMKITSDAERWNLRLKELEAFKKAHAHFRIPANDEKYKALYNWVSNSQAEYSKLQKGLKSRLTDERIAQFESIGFRLGNRREPDNEHRDSPTTNTSANKAEMRNGEESCGHSSLKSGCNMDIDGTDSSKEDSSARQSESVIAPRLERKSNRQSSFDTSAGAGAMKSHQESPKDLSIADNKDPSPAATLSFLEGLDETVMLMMAEMNRVEQERKNAASNPNAIAGKPNCFWLDIGHCDGIDF